MGSSISNEAINFYLQGYIFTSCQNKIHFEGLLMDNNDQVLMLEIMKLFNIVCMPGVYQYKCEKVSRVTVTFWCPRYHVTIFFTVNCSKIDKCLHKYFYSNYIHMGKLKIKLIAKLILLF